MSARNKRTNNATKALNPTEVEARLAGLVKKPFDRKEFIYQLIACFDAPKATLTRLRSGESNKADRPGDLLWEPKLYFTVSRPGQAAGTLDRLRVRKPAKTHKPRFFIVTDGKEFSAFDANSDESLHCKYSQLKKHFEFFLPLAGIEKYQGVEENPADVKAANRLSKLYDEIVSTNPDWKATEKQHALNQFMTRLLFCMFAEDTGGFKKDLLVKVISEQSGTDGEHLQPLLTKIFKVLNVPEKKRGKLPVHIMAFPYVNGGLFAEAIEVPIFSKRAQRLLIEAAELDWRDINPDIFGTMIQAVVNPELRGELGIHYTSVPNIMKVLQPLFLMSLEEDLDNANGHRQERAMLNKLLTRLHNIRVFDPACGSGNFLIIAYRELRKLETRIFQRQDKLEKTTTTTHRSGVKLANFYGIELADFAAETAKLSLWITEYQMNQQFSQTFGKKTPSFPLNPGGQIHTGNALRMDWADVCPSLKGAAKDTETYLVGNPPYLGSTNQNKDQKADLAHVFSRITKNYKKLDYVTAWYLKGAQYCAEQQAQCAFVATNSICQGDSVGLLWPLIFDCGIEINFAYPSFKWTNNASHNAGVTCIIVGIRQQEYQAKCLFEDGARRQVSNIGPYLIEMPNTIVHNSVPCLNGLPKMLRGNQPTDDGNLILSPSEKTQLLEKYPQAEPLIRRLIGSQELIKGIERYCLWIKDEDLPLAKSIKPVAERIKKVQLFRKKSPSVSTRKSSAYAYKFQSIRKNIDSEHAIIIPRVSSDNRPYIPIGLITDGEIVTDSAFAIYDAPLYLFAIIASTTHLSWIKTVCGKLKTDYRYSNTLGYNTFPIPPLSQAQKNSLEKHAWKILEARDAHSGKTLAWLYDPKTMPVNVLAAHQALDNTLEKIYIGRPFRNDRERLEHLFSRYEEMIGTQQRRVANG